MSFDIAEARAKHGTLLKISSSSGLFYFKLPSKAEFDNYNFILNKFNTELLAGNYLIECCLLYPKDQDTFPIEIIAMANAIIEHSGFHDIGQFETLVKNYRDKSKELGEKVVAMILKAFPGYSLKQVESLTAPEIARHLVLSEMILEQSSIIPNPTEAGNTSKLNKELSDKDKEQAQKLRNISKDALDQIKKR